MCGQCETSRGLFDQSGNVYVDNDLIVKGNVSYSGVAQFPQEITSATFKATNNNLTIAPFSIADGAILDFEDGTRWLILEG